MRLRPWMPVALGALLAAGSTAIPVSARSAAERGTATVSTRGAITPVEVVSQTFGPSAVSNGSEWGCGFSASPASTLDMGTQQIRFVGAQGPDRPQPRVIYVFRIDATGADAAHLHADDQTNSGALWRLSGTDTNDFIEAAEGADLDPATGNYCSWIALTFFPEVPYTSNPKADDWVNPGQKAAQLERLDSTGASLGSVSLTATATPGDMPICRVPQVVGKTINQAFTVISHAKGCKRIALNPLRVKSSDRVLWQAPAAGKSVPFYTPITLGTRPKK